MRILFINPPMQYPVNYPGPNRVVMQHDFAPPLGLMSISAFIKQNGYDDVELIQGQTKRPPTDENILETVDTYKPDVVGITVSTVTYYNAIRIASLIKSVRPQTVLVVGGPHVTIYPEETASQPPVDFAVVGEGEYTFLELLRALEKSGSLEPIQGLVWKRDGQTVMNPPRQFNEPLDALPMPDYSICDLKEHRIRFDDIAPTGIIITSRGCPFRCTFCCVIYPYYRERSAETVVDEMERLKALGYRSVTFWDDTFNLSRERVVRICQLIQERNLKLPWSFRGRVTGVDDELASILSKAGCVRASFGVESGNQDRLDKIKKGITIEQVQEAFSACKKHGIQIMAFFMMGFPHETAEEAQRTVQFAFELDPDYAVFHTLLPLPGTEIYQEAMAAGAFPDYIRTFARHPTPDFQIRLWETGMTQKELYHLYRMTILRFYFRPTYIWKTLRRIHSLENFLTKIKTALSVLVRLHYR